jgi:predicted nucleotidyltransferase
MSNYISQLVEKELIHPPKWLPGNVLFEGLTGSVAYACSTDTSDMDVVGFCMPPKETIFPHLRGEIFGFGTPGERFEQFQQHGIDVPEWNKRFDITSFSIVKFMQLAMENNPNVIELLFLPRRCILTSTQISEHIRSHRHQFLHLGGFHKNRGYAMSTINNMKKIDRTHVYEVLKSKFNLSGIPTIEEINNELKNRNNMSGVQASL